MPIEYLDGRRMRRVIVAGSDWVRHRRDHINKINVFPVADGDTGTNMALSLSATAAAVRPLDERDLAHVAGQAAEASILGAKGNSGVILAHWFLGFSSAVRGRETLRASDVPACLAAASDAVFNGVDNPVEGTIVTVMRAVSDRAVRIGAACTDLSGLLDDLLATGREALARTPEQLEVLRAANVVDAGAEGFVSFLEGVSRAVEGAALAGTAPAAVEEAMAQVHDDQEQSLERFCTEVVIRGQGLDDERIRRRLRPLGTSLLVAGTGAVCKVHIHTDHPDDLFKIAAGFGDVVERKVDDMHQQRAERGVRAQQPLVPFDAQPHTVAVISDSTADLPPALRAEFGIEMAPLQVLFGDEVFRDQVDLDTEGFYQRLSGDHPHPTTSQPPPRAFVEALDRIRVDREALVLTLSAGLSGTYESACTASRLAEHPAVRVFDSGTVSTGLGMIALNAARYARAGASMAELLAWAERWREDSGLVFTLATLEYLRRGGRIGAAQSLIGSMLGVRPVLTLEDGKVVPLDKGRGAETVYRKALGALEAQVPPGSRIRAGLIQIAGTDRLDRLESDLRERYDVIELSRGEPTGVIGAHAGPGAWGVFFQRVRDDDPLL